MVYTPLTIEAITKGKYSTPQNDDPTGITEAPTFDQNAKIYDLSGRQVEKGTKGVYIVNGKKVVF